MRKTLAAALVAFAVPSLASTWTSYEQLQGAARVNLRGHLEDQSRDAGALFTGSRDSSSASSATPGADSTIKSKAEKPVLGKKEKKEPPNPAAKRLKLMRAAGLGAAVLGGSMVGSSVLAGAAIPMFGLTLLFLGGMAAYLANRRLKGKTSGIFG